MKVNVLDKGYVELIDSMGTDRDVVQAARISYVAEPPDRKGEMYSSDKKRLRHLYINKHTTPFEMVEFKFKVKAPLFVVRQWQRHRTWSYNELSRRYTGEDIEFYVPDCDGDYSEAAIECFHEEAMHAYRDILAHGGSKNLSAKELARLVLPKTVYSTMYAKVDLHNLLHFLRLRNHPHAQWEIQEYARAIEKLIEPIVPETMKLYREEKHGYYCTN